MNIVSDVQITLALSQIKLFSTLINEFFSVFDTPLSDKLVRPEVVFPYPYIPPPQVKDESLNVSSSDIVRDSGFETSDLKSNVSSRTKVSLVKVSI